MNAQKYIDSLMLLQHIAPLEPDLNVSKYDLLAAEVTLPLKPGIDVSLLRLIEMRPPFKSFFRPVVVDVSRLPAA